MDLSRPMYFLPVVVRDMDLSRHICKFAFCGSENGLKSSHRRMLRDLSLTMGGLPTAGGFSIAGGFAMSHRTPRYKNFCQKLKKAPAIEKPPAIGHSFESL